MKPSHVTGGAIGGLLGVLAVGLAHHFKITSMTDTDAALVGGAAVGAGVGIAHAVWNIGIAPLCKRLWRGPAPTTQAGA